MKKTKKDYAELIDKVLWFLKERIDKLPSKLPEHAVAEVAVLQGVCPVETVDGYIERKGASASAESVFDAPLPGVLIGDIDEGFSIDIIINATFSKTKRHGRIILEGYYLGCYKVECQHGGPELSLVIPSDSELHEYTQLVDGDEKLVIIA